MASKALTAEALREALSYDEASGVFTWVKPTGRRAKAGDAAGSPTSAGYLLIGVCGKRILAHRLAWFWCHGEWPTGDIDHIDGNPLNNAITNLRHATRSQNMLNVGLRSTNTSGYKGVSFDKRSGSYRARIWQDNECFELGFYPTAVAASEAYRAAALQRYGEYAWPR